MPERLITPLILMVLFVGALWALRPVDSAPVSPVAVPSVGSRIDAMIPLVTGDEPIPEIFTRAGCVVCHTIPGIPGAAGQVGPPLFLGLTGPARLADPLYRGQAKSVHEYVIESVIEPRLFVVPGYPSGTMPTWYGAKLSALALERIASYLERQGVETVP